MIKEPVLAIFGMFAMSPNSQEIESVLIGSILLPECYLHGASSPDSQGLLTQTKENIFSRLDIPDLTGALLIMSRNWQSHNSCPSDQRLGTCQHAMSNHDTTSK
jgi:hypothetical protein